MQEEKCHKRRRRLSAGSAGGVGADSADHDADGDGVIHRSEIRHVILAAYRLGGHYHPGKLIFI